MSSHRKGFGKPINVKDGPVLYRLVLASHGHKLYDFIYHFFSTHNDLGQATYTIMLHHQEGLQGSDMADYKRGVVDV